MCVRERSIEDSGVALVAVLEKETLGGVAMLQSRRFRVGNCLLPYVSISLDKNVFLS
jgi:hypothetical protein